MRWLAEVTEFARGMRDADLDWSASNYIMHWRQRMACVLGQGRSQVITAAVAHRKDERTAASPLSGGDGRSASREHDPHGL